ncbi:MAG: epimerase [Candidatus Marinimicrobia bacterium]|nr:epimerase [Candidatus Neomarinimicrobiota bacterium]
MIKVGITGSTGFIGSHLYNYLRLDDSIELINFRKCFFDDGAKLKKFISNCDVLVHLAAINRCHDGQTLYDVNINLIKKLLDSMEGLSSKPSILFSSSTQEKKDNRYGFSKKDGRLLFEDWSKNNNSSFINMQIPNVYGPFCKPNYNSFIATFSNQLIKGEMPKIIEDNRIDLIYVGSLCKIISNKIKLLDSRRKKIENELIPPDYCSNVSKVLETLVKFKKLYIDKGILPSLLTSNDINLFNTFRSYINLDSYFPVKLKIHSDKRGSFVETIKLEMGGQVSFSTTVPNITRGDHFHTRKIERFIVIKGKALIQLRKIGETKIYDFILDGDIPSYIDMPVWYTHNIKNIGKQELITKFWINEFYDPHDPDTFFEKV